MAGNYDFHDPRSQDPEADRLKDLEAKTEALRSASTWFNFVCIAFAIMAFMFVIFLVAGKSLR